MEKIKVLMALMGLEIGGAETHVLELCKALQKKGVEVLVVSNGGAYVQELSDNGIVHYKAPLHNKQIFNLLASYRILKKIIRENDIKLVHAHARIPAFLCGILHKKMDFRFITTAHWLFTTKFPFNILTDWGEKTLAVSDDIKKYLTDNYKVNQSNVRVTINGIDTDKFSPPLEASEYAGIVEEFSLEYGKTRIVYTSRMDRDRSHAAHKLIEAAEAVYQFNNRIEIIIVGGGNDFNEVKKKADKINSKIAQKIIYLTGARVDINKFLKSADIFVGVSRSALEAMAVAVPVIVAGNEGYIGIFNEDKLDVGINTNFCCRGCPETTREQLEKDLTTILKMTEEERKTLGGYGREIIQKNYSVVRMADDAIAVYKSVPLDVKRKVDVVLSGYYGYENNGDDIVLKSIVEDFKRLDENINIVVLSRLPNETRKIYNVDAVYRFDFLKIWRMLKSTKLLVSGGGSLIQDLTSTHSLLYYLYVIRAAKMQGAKVMLYANGIGPLKKAKNRKRVKNILNKVDLITLRDKESLEEIKKLEINAPPVYLTADAAFSVSPMDYEDRGKELLGKNNLDGIKYFCISVRSWKYLKPGFEEQIAEFADYIVEKYHIVPLFIPMQPANDTEISKKILSLMKQKGYFLEDKFNFEEILGVVHSAEFILAMRLHTVVYAIKTGRPVIALVYDKKVKAMMDSTNQTSYEYVEQIKAERLKKFADEIITNQESISEKLAKMGQIAKEDASKNIKFAMELIEKGGHDEN